MSKIAALKTVSLNSILLIFFVTMTCCSRPPAIAKTKHLVKTRVNITKLAPLSDTLIFAEPELSKLVQQTYKYFEILDTIVFIEDGYEIKKFNFSKKELIDFGNAAGITLTQEKVESFNITAALTSMVTENYLRILKWKEIDRYDLSLLFKKYVSIAKSPDSKLYCFSFDERTGGSYKSRISIIHYDPKNGTLPQSNFIGEDDVFNRDGYDVIDTINTDKGVKYLLQGSVTGCTTCIGNYVDLVHLDHGKFVLDFNYKVDTRGYGSGSEESESPILSYNSKSRLITINYFTNDLTPYCNCGIKGIAENDEGLEWDDNSKPAEVNCTYIFNGKTFKLLKKRI